MTLPAMPRGNAVLVLLILAAYYLGVYNERGYPGDRWVPTPGEVPYWAALALLVLLAALFPHWRKS